MKTRKFLTSLAAAVMLSAGLAGSGIAMSQPAQTVQAASDRIQVKFRTVNGTVNSDNITVLGQTAGSNIPQKVDFVKFSKGQTVPIYYSIVAQGKRNNQTVDVPLYSLGTQTYNGQTWQLFVQQSDITPSGTVPTEEQFSATRQNDIKTIQNAYNNRSLKYIVVTPKSKKGARIYYAYKKSAKSKKIFFKASRKKVKYGKKFKSKLIVKNGKRRYVYLGKKRYARASAMKMKSAKYTAIKLPADIQALITNN